jgi:hypothetical protein
LNTNGNKPSNPSPEELSNLNDRIARFGAILVAIAVVMFCVAIAKVESSAVRIILFLLSGLLAAFGIFILVVVAVGSGMEKNKTNEGVQETASGLQYKIENPGNELRATAIDTVEVHYKGTLLDGKVFDSSYDRGETAKFPLNRVIPGWTEGMQLVGEGGKITLWVPFNLGYGANAASADLPAYSTLVFEVELIKVCKAEEKKKK